MLNIRSFKIQSILPVFSLLTLATIFLVFKYGADHFTGWLFSGGQTALLNSLTQGDGGATAEFYKGRMNEVLWGPIAQVAAGLLLIALSLRYMKNASFVKYFTFIFCFLLAMKCEVLLFPPYGDTIGGPLAEAIWLLHNNFNFQLLSQQPHYLEGGPRVYLYSIYPAFQAGLMKILPGSFWYLLVNHVIVFAQAAVVLTVLRKNLLNIFDETVAVLLPIFVFSFPLFQSQVEAINMEMPLLFFSILAMDKLIQKRFIAATFLAVLATLVKGSGVVPCMTIAAVCLLLSLRNKKLRVRLQMILCALTMVLFIGFMVYLMSLALTVHIKEGKIGLFRGYPSLIINLTTYLYMICAAIFIYRFFKDKHAGALTFYGAVDQYFPQLIFFVYSGSWFLFFLNSDAVSPRYWFMLSPFVAFCIYFTFQELCRSREWQKRGLILATVLALINSYGIYWRAMTENDHVVLERSLEYRNDLRVARLIAETVEERFSSWTVAAPFTLAQMLAFKELGYVSKKLDVMIYGMLCTYGGIKNFNGLIDLDLKKTIWVGVNVSKLGIASQDFTYPLDKDDRVIKEFVCGNKSGVLFLGGFAIERMRILNGLIIKVKSMHKVQSMENK